MRLNSDIDEQNPEWTKTDFREARPARELPAEILKAFPRKYGPQKSPKKVLVSMRLSANVIEGFKADGRGWPACIYETLKRALGL